MCPGMRFNCIHPLVRLLRYAAVDIRTQSNLMKTIKEVTSHLSYFSFLPVKPFLITVARYARTSSSSSSSSFHPRYA